MSSIGECKSDLNGWHWFCFFLTIKKKKIILNPITNHDWWIMKVYQLEKRQKASRLVGTLWWSVWCATVLLGETLWPPPRDLNSLQTSCRRCSVWTFLKSINTGIHRGSGGLSERWRAVPQHDWDGHEIPQIRGCWANTPVGRGGGEEGGDRKKESSRRERDERGCEPVLSCPSSPPSHTRVYSEKSAACGSS